MKITFLGATQEVTGSKYLLENEETKVLVDCGLFQGVWQLRKRNWDPFPLEPSSIEAIVLTHAHIDHTGYIPVLIKNGFRGRIYCSPATYELCKILLIDSGKLQEEDARKYNESRSSKHNPALPLYTADDAQYALKYFSPVDFDKMFKIGSLQFTLISSGHILGASFVIVFDGKKTLTFSGDLGRPEQLLMKAPTHLTNTDYLVLESTYGDRLHKEDDPIKMLGEVVSKTIARGGVIIIPAFAVGRSQAILYSLYQLKKQKVIPDIPVYLDSPMAISVTNLYCKFQEEHKLSAQLCSDVFDNVHYTRTQEESNEISRINHPAVIIAGSGMGTGGRALDHFTHFISDSKNTILFVGFQGLGTDGRALVEGAQEIELYGKMYPVHAHIEMIDSLSAHADYDEILDWLGYFKKSPKKLFLTHGELKSAQALKKKIEDRFGWKVVIPKYLETFNLD